MKIIEKYTGEKTYMFPNGVLATKEAVLAEFPSALVFTHVVETDENGEVMWAMQNLSAMRSMYNIDKGLSESQAIEKLQELVNEQAQQIINAGPSDMERIASAMELQALNGMADMV